MRLGANDTATDPPALLSHSCSLSSRHAVLADVREFVYRSLRGTGGGGGEHGRGAPALEAGGH